MWPRSCLICETDGKREQFELALSQALEAKISTHSFNEDAFAGLKTSP